VTVANVHQGTRDSVTICLRTGRWFAHHPASPCDRRRPARRGPQPQV